ncbi:protein YIF1B [Anthonomus grandis grandis]|uniref:protein YIF1B n=1 Tax=Anthonomus grandis grandis TaxID=2921223 RepID=UPI002165EA1F|nr:protein YIF1B [Anthonomus grandis grandis]
MNYNANTGPRPANFGKKVKRVSDVNAMGYSSYTAQNQPQGVYPNLPASADVPMQTPNFQQSFGNQQQYEAQQYSGGAPSPVPNFNPSAIPSGQYPPSFPMAANLAVLGQPVVQDMAMQYGQQLAGAGKTIIKQEMEKYVPVSKLKFYFAVDTRYVISKLALLFFPFTHSDWSVKYEQNHPVQPRYEINAPDLYIPSMAYITYVLVAGLVLGMQDKFSPEQIGITASSALAWCLIELAIYSTILYILQVETSLKTLDLLAYSGYKFVGTITSILASVVAGRAGFYASLVYVNLALAFFLVRSMKVQVLAEQGTKEHVYYGGGGQGHKRRLYFLLFVVGVQSVLSWWLSFHLVPQVALEVDSVGPAT